MIMKISLLLKKVPHWAELLLILLLCFGFPILKSLNNLLNGQAFTKVEFDDARIILTLIAEIIISAICISFLWLRGYKIWERLNFSPSLKGSIWAVGLLVASYLAYIILFIIVTAIIGRENLKVADFSFSVSVFPVLLISLINPLFEEAFVLGYLFDKLQTKSLLTVVMISTLIRTSYHLYQGWIGLLSILPMGILFALTYSRTRNLWSVYLAHLAMDLIGLSSH